MIKRMREKSKNAVPDGKAFQFLCTQLYVTMFVLVGLTIEERGLTIDRSKRESEISCYNRRLGKGKNTKQNLDPSKFEIQLISLAELKTCFDISAKDAFEIIAANKTLLPEDREQDRLFLLAIRENRPHSLGAIDMKREARLKRTAEREAQAFARAAKEEERKKVRFLNACTFHLQSGLVVPNLIIIPIHN